MSSWFYAGDTPRVVTEHAHTHTYITLALGTTTSWHWTHALPLDQGDRSTSLEFCMRYLEDRLALLLLLLLLLLSLV